MQKRIAILGSTGSIGVQALEVVANHSERFKVEILTANGNAGLLIQQAMRFRPSKVVINNETLHHKVNDALAAFDIEVLAGSKHVSEIVCLPTIDIVLVAVVGYAGVLPALNAALSGKHIALANKESLVVAGDLITKAASENDAKIIPVDSEHSAIFQCLAGENPDTIEKIYLTASGGPFRGKDIEYLKTVTKHEALKHPNWEMGNKITIDSATMMNKGLEVIEAHWLFGLLANQIDVVVHPQSVIHSVVQFVDGSMKAQMGIPDMKLPIVYAMNFPERLKTGLKRFSFSEYQTFTFEKPDMKVFRNLELAYYALGKGGNLPCIVNAANEIAVEAFLNDAIGFLQIPDIIEKATGKISFIAKPQYEDYVSTNDETRKISKELINKISF